MKEFLDMHGYGAYVWSSYGLAMAGLVLNVWLAQRKHKAAREQARRKLAMKEAS
jgi:heme exporter protein CcmD